MSECRRNNLYVDCDDSECLNAGNIGADCPKWVCDMPNVCDQCLWIREYVQRVRNQQGLGELFNGVS